MEISSKVLSGATLLDQKRPGWWQEIEPTLSEDDMASLDDCILARLYGSYNEGIKAVFAGTQYYFGGDFGFHYDGHNVAAQWNELIRKLRVSNTG